MEKIYLKKYQKNEVLNRFIALKLLLTMVKLWYYGKNYGTIPKTMELWFTMEKLWYYGKNNDTLINYS